MKTIQGAKYRWQIPQHDDHVALQIASKYNIAVPLAHSILSRGYTSDAQIDEYYLVYMNVMLLMHHY